MKLIALLLFSIALCGQQQSGPAATKGTCSPANTGNNNVFNITCQGISEKLGVQLVNLLNQISKNQIDADAIMKKLDGCLSATADRHLTQEQKASLIASLVPFRGHKISIVSVLGDKEGKAFAADFVEVFRKAEWTGLEGSGHAEANYNVDPIGLMLLINPVDVDQHTVPPDAVLIQVAGKRAGIDIPGAPNPSHERGTFELVVGVKPPARQ